MIRAAIAVAAVCVASMSFAQQRMPTDVELKAMYCLTVHQSWLSDINSLANFPDQRYQDAKKKVMDGVKDNLNRLSLYLMPRILGLDPVGLALARQRAQTDLNQLRIHSTECFNSCPSKDDQARCTEEAKACMPEELVERIHSCINLNWLPF